jgi:membrane protease YdiL (CAAX protease family)
VLVETDNCILQLIMFVTGSDKPPPDLLDMSRSPIGAAILVIVVAPLLEEYLFRGLILRGLLTHHRRIVAVGIAALAFGIAHGNVRQFFLAVIIGLAFGWWYVRTRSVGPGIIGHATFNAVAWGAAQLGDVSRALGMHRDQGPVVHEPWWLTLGGLALVALGIWSFHRDAPAGGPASFPLPLPSSAVEPPLLPEPPLLGPPQATGAVRAAAPAS